MIWHVSSACCIVLLNKYQVYFISGSDLDVADMM